MNRHPPLPIPILVEFRTASHQRSDAAPAFRGLVTTIDPRDRPKHQRWQTFFASWAATCQRRIEESVPPGMSFAITRVSRIRFITSHPSRTEHECISFEIEAVLYERADAREPRTH